MGLFDKFLAERAKEDPSQSTGEDGHSTAYIDLLSAYLGRARLRQYAFFRDVLVGNSWSVDFESGTIAFGEHEYPVQLLGSESYITNTWLWAVENVNGFDEGLLRDAFLFYNSSMMERLPDLKNAQIPLTRLVNGHNIASIVSGAHYEKTVYYRCPYEGGAAFVIVRGVPDSIFAPAGYEEIIKLITDLIKQLPLNHKVLVKNLFLDNCESVEGSISSLTGYFPDGRAVLVTFNKEGLLSTMQLTNPD